MNIEKITLPVSPHLENIVNVIKNNPTSMIVAPTGSGKTLGIPLALSALEIKTFISVPTRMIAIGTYESQLYIQQDLRPKNEASSIVGYASQGKINYTKNTKIVYATSGHIRRKMLRYFSRDSIRPIDFCDVLIVDEIHTGSIDNTVIISLWCLAFLKGVKVPKLVMMSATPNYVGRISPEPEVYEVVIESSYTVEPVYHNRDYDLSKDDSILWNDIAKIAYKFHTENPYDDGHILIFGPGLEEIETIGREITNMLKDYIGTFELFILYGGASQEVRQKVLSESSQGIRKIIVGTNAVEAGITINNVGFVIDSLTEKVIKVSQSGGLRLVSNFSNKNSSKQRCGRTGRTRSGICYRMCTKEFYDEKLKQNSELEINRIPIHQVLIELISSGVIPTEVLIGVDFEKLKESMNSLFSLGMIDYKCSRKIKLSEEIKESIDNLIIPNSEKNNDVEYIQETFNEFQDETVDEVQNVDKIFENYKNFKIVEKEIIDAICITDQGNFANDFKLGIINITFLYRWLTNGNNPFTGLIIASLIDSFNPSYFISSRRLEGEDTKTYNQRINFENMKKFSKYYSYDTLSNCLLLYQDLIYASSENPEMTMKDNIKLWCKQHSISTSKVFEFLEIYDSSSKKLIKKGYKSTIEPLSIKNALKQARDIFIDIIPDRIMKHIGNGIYYQLSTGFQFRVDIRGSLIKGVENGRYPKYILGILIFETEKNNKITRIINFFISLDETNVQKYENMLLHKKEEHQKIVKEEKFLENERIRKEKEKELEERKRKKKEENIKRHEENQRQQQEKKQEKKQKNKDLKKIKVMQNKIQDKINNSIQLINQ